LTSPTSNSTGTHIFAILYITNFHFYLAWFGIGFVKVERKGHHKPTLFAILYRKDFDFCMVRV